MQKAICVLAIFARLAAAAKLGGSKPHVVFVMADDLGSNDVGWSDASVLSPELDKLAEAGVKLSSCYTWDWCAPSRGAMLSGKYPSTTGFQGSGGPTNSGSGNIAVFPSEHPMIPATLKTAGYFSVMAGKWHLGYARPEDTPEGRGFDRFLGYFTGGEDYYVHNVNGAKGCLAAHDLWYASNVTNGRPAAIHRDYTEYSTTMYAEFVANQIRGHDSAVPLFVYAAFQGVHYPLQVPRKYFQRYAEQGADAGACMWDEQGTTPAGHQNGFTCKPNPNYPGLSHVGAACECNRLLVKAQVSALSEAVGNITSALQERGLWNNTVLIFMGDNGGPNDGAHSNAPLRGGKLNFFEGGIRPAAFVTSPLLPASARGTTYTGMLHETDWFATLAYLAGATPPPDLDGINVWNTLEDPTVSHRTEVLIADHILRSGRWKLVTGVGHPTGAGAWKTGELKGCVLGNGGGWETPPTTESNNCPGDIYTTSGGSPGLLGCPDDAALNKTHFAVTDPIDLWLCSNPCTPETPCLWDLDADPHERQETSAAHKDTVATLLARLQTLQRTFRNATTISDNGRFCDVLKTRQVSGIGYFIGPWIGV